MPVYEIRTVNARREPALIMVAEYIDAGTAIVASREYLRTGETIEIWCEGVLIYRTLPRNTSQ
jgi:hypothetical protein